MHKSRLRDPCVARRVVVEACRRGDRRWSCSDGEAREYISRAIEREEARENGQSLAVREQTYGVGGLLPWTATVACQLPRVMSREEALAWLRAELLTHRLPQRIAALSLDVTPTPRGWAPGQLSFEAHEGTYAYVHLEASTTAECRACDVRKA